MQGKDSNRSGVTSFFTKLFRQQIFIPLAALVLLAVFNLIADPGFFKITLGYNSAGNPVLSGFLITILDSGSCYRYDARYCGIRRTGYQCGRSHCHQRQCITAGTVWDGSTSGAASGAYYCRFSCELSCSDAVRSV